MRACVSARARVQLKNTRASVSTHQSSFIIFYYARIPRTGLPPLRACRVSLVEGVTQRTRRGGRGW